MLFLVNLTCLQEIFRSKTIPFGNFYAANKKIALGINQVCSHVAGIKYFIFHISFFLSTVLSAGLERNMSHYSAFGSRAV